MPYVQNMAALDPRQLRSVYLITYSQADVTRFATRDSFANAVLRAFDPTPARVVQYACSRESHADGGMHYHMAIKLDRNQRWLRVKRSLEAAHNIVVNFRGTHPNYYTAYRYVTKEDGNAVHSDDHPVLHNPPPTQAALEVLTQGRGRKRKRADRLTNFEVGEIVRANQLKTRLHILAFAEKQRADGKTDLAEFIFNRGKKNVDEIIATAWEMARAEAALERAQLRRIEILRQCLNTDCVPGCNQQWLHQAEDILQRNQIEKDDFSAAVETLLTEGRGQYRNIMITGPTNCGKSFILQPLTKIYQIFSNPATTTYAWIGAAEAEVIHLNDFRWCQQVLKLISSDM